jgi:hypothetical protein
MQYRPFVQTVVLLAVDLVRIYQHGLPPRQFEISAPDRNLGTLAPAAYRLEQGLDLRRAATGDTNAKCV